MKQPAASPGRIAVPLRAAFLWIVLLAMLTCAVNMLLAPLSIFSQLGLAVRSILLIPVLNLLPILLLMLLLFFITNSLAGAVAPVMLCAIAMGIANRLKQQMRGDPLVHWDLSMITEVLGVARGFGWKPIAAIVIGLAAFIALAIWLGHRYKARRMRWFARLAGALACVAAMLVANATLYSSKALYKSLPVQGTEYNLSDVHNSRGNIYAFLYNWNAYKVREPEGYDQETTAAFIEQYSEGVQPPEDPERPHIVMIMCEAFSDLSQSDAVDFTGYVDPLAHYKALSETGISGHIVVPGRGGGTADTEADVLTARPSRYLRFAPYAYRLISSPIEAMPSMLREIGYDAFALHPGFSWFYNRQNAYRYLGFDELVFSDAFDAADYRDYYISESATYDKFIDMIDSRLDADPDQPVFAFCLTIQNHASYGGRFLAEGEVNFSTELDMTDEEINELGNYFAAIADADAQLARMAAYLDTLKEPAILICYGDHLPSLPAALYDALIPGADAPAGSKEQETRLNRLPFLIWENTAARAAGTLNRESEAAALPDDGTISSNYLGAYLLQLLELDGLSPLFRYANDTRQLFPIIKESAAFTMDGKSGETATPQELEALQMYRDWVYYETAGKR